jgi:arsenite methyltransferase
MPPRLARSIGMNEKTVESPTQNLQAFVSEYYGKLLASSGDLKTNACCASGAPPAWIASRLTNVHESVSNRFYGCGFPIPHGLQGATVVDLAAVPGVTCTCLPSLSGRTVMSTAST